MKAKKVKEFILKYVLLVLSMTGVLSINYFLDVLSKGNLLGIGMGTYLMSLVGLLTIFITLQRIIFKEKKDGRGEQSGV